MAALGAQSIASSYEQLLHVDRDLGGDTTTHVSVKDGDNGTTFALTLATDAVMITSTNRLEFGDDGTYIFQSANGVLDLVSDTEIEINATTIDINGAVAMDGATTGGTNITISGELDAATLDISGNAAIDGNVTMPGQPAFLARASAAQANIAIDTAVTIVFGTEVFDQGGDFNNTSGGTAYSFTAPVAGRYQLNAAIRVVALDSAADYYLMKIITSNRNYANILIDPDFGQDAAYWNFHNSVLADMDASDTAYITLQQSGGTQQTDIDSGDSDTHFSGYLAC
jgi:hypothetical protein